MGNYFSQDNSNLEDRVKRLQEIVDKNSDGIVTREELESYVKSQLNNTKSETEKWKEAYENLYTQFSELQKEYEKLQDNYHPRSIEPKSNYVSVQALERYIESEIINTDANLKYVPDAIERKAYLAVYKTLMKSLEGLCNTTSIDLMNHKLTFVLVPNSESNNETKPDNKN